MRFTAAAAAALATGAAAQKVVSFDLNRGLPGTRIGTPPTLPLSKRDYHGGSIYNNITGGGYYVDVTVGTPGQPITLVLDTGSSDVWFLSYQADLCTSRSLQARYGDSCGTTFNPTKSSSYAVKVRNGFNITYLDGTGATGSYITDDLAINGATIKSLQMGLATSVVRGVGVLGVGFSANEAAATPYPNIIDELATQGLISSRAFSLYLNDRRSDTGTLLFGGVDTSKFVGPLHVLPIPEQTTGYTHYGVVMSSLAATYSNGSTVALGDTLVGAILDSGTTLSYLPDDVATPLFDQLGVYTDYSGSGYSMVDCGLLDSEPDLVVTFGFGNGQASGGDKFTIAVPVYELVLDLLGGYSELTADAPFDNVCLFGIQSSGGGFGGSDAGAASSGITLLGDTFLRSAYVVYDLDHHQIGMAQANLNATGETKITELDGSGSVLPSFTGVSAQQSGTATATTRRTATTTTTTSTSASTGTGTSTGGSASSATSGATNTDIGGQSSNTGTPKANAAAPPVGGGEGAFAVAVVAGLFVVGGGFVL